MRAHGQKDIDTRIHQHHSTPNLVYKMTTCGSSRRSLAGSNQRHRKRVHFYDTCCFCRLGIDTSILLERFPLSNKRTLWETPKTCAAYVNTSLV